MQRTLEFRQDSLNKLSWDKNYYDYGREHKVQFIKHDKLNVLFNITFHYDIL
jgi:hypothetical protein